MKMKRFVAAAIAAVSCLSFAACGSDTASKDENVIHIMSSGDSSANMERALVDEYNKTADVKAVLDLVTSADYQNKLQTVMSNPKSDSAPDIFFNWADALMIQYARADVSAPLDEYMEKDPELKDNFLPSILDAAKVDGKYYGIPVRGVQPIVLFYNKKVLSDNGIEAPTTFDEFCDACEKLKSAGLTPIALGGGDQWPTLNWYSVIYQQVMGNDDVQKMMDGGVRVELAQEQEGAGDYPRHGRKGILRHYVRFGQAHRWRRPGSAGAGEGRLRADGLVRLFGPQGRGP